MLAETQRQEARTEQNRMRRLIKALWLELRVTEQTNGAGAPDQKFMGVEGWFKRDELGLGADQSPSIVYTLANLEAINRRNRADLARREGGDLGAERRRLAPTQAKPRRDKNVTAQAARRLMASAGVKMRGGMLVRCG